MSYFEGGNGMRNPLNLLVIEFEGRDAQKIALFISPKMTFDKSHSTKNACVIHWMGTT